MSKFSNLRTVKADVAGPPPHYGQPDLKVSAFFEAFPKSNDKFNVSWVDMDQQSEFQPFLNAGEAWTGFKVVDSVDAG